MAIPKSEAYGSRNRTPARTTQPSKPEEKKADQAKSAKGKAASAKYDIEREIARVAKEEQQRARRSAAPPPAAKAPAQPAVPTKPAKSAADAQAARVDRMLDGSGPPAVAKPKKPGFDPVAAQAARSERMADGLAHSPSGPRSPASPGRPAAPSGGVDRTAAQAARVDRMINPDPQPRALPQRNVRVDPVAAQAARVDRRLDEAERMPQRRSAPPQQAGGTVLGTFMSYVSGAAYGIQKAIESTAHQGVSTILGGLQTIDVKPRIDGLQRTGDRVTVTVGIGGKMASVVPGYVPVPVGGRGEYSYEVKITQVAPAPGQTAPRYEVDFGKQLLGVATADLSLGSKGLTPKVNASAAVLGELGGAVTDRVVMTFATKEEAARAVQLLGRSATADTVRAIGQVASPTWPLPNVFTNPLHGKGGDPGPGAAPLPWSPLAALNPIAGPAIGAITRSITNQVADRFAPSGPDASFLEDHVSAYRQTFNTHGRGLFSTWINASLPLADKGGLGLPGIDQITRSLTGGYGVTPFVDVQPTITREITLPQDGKPAALSYAVSQNVSLREADKLRAQPQIKGYQAGTAVAGAEANLTAMAIGEVGKVTMEGKVTWNLSPQQALAVKQSRGTSLPETSLFRQGNDPVPDKIDAKMEVTVPARGQSTAWLLAPTEQDQEKVTVTASVRNPGQHAADVWRKGVLPAVAGAASDSQAVIEHTYLERSGVNSWNELGGSVSIKGQTVATGFVSGQVKVVTEKVRTSTRLEMPAPQPPSPPQRPAPRTSPDRSGDTDTPRSIPSPPPRRSEVAGTDEGSVPPPPPRGKRMIDLEPPPVVNPGIGEQVVIVPHDGLNVRAGPGAVGAKTAVLRHGTFAQTTGRMAVDAEGTKWVEVKGPDANRRQASGWVAAEHVKSHPDGAEGALGRIDFELRQLGYRPVIVKPGDTVNDLAARHGVDARRAVVVNRDNHVIDPDMIFPGDTVYLPSR